MSGIHPSVAAAAVVGFSSIAAIFDVRQRRIPNKLTAVTLVAGLVLHLVTGGFAAAGWAALAGLIAGAVFMLFHLAGGMGAGDVKLMTALGCVAGMHDVRMLLVMTAIVGALFAVSLALWRGALRRTMRNVVELAAHHSHHGLVSHPELNVSNSKTLRLPYAVPMAVASMLVFVQHLLPGGVQ